MKDKIKDFWYDYGEKIQIIGKIGASLIALFVFLGVIFGWFDTEKEIKEAQVNELKGKYTELSRVEIGQPEKNAINLSILLSDPFMNQASVESLAQYLVEQEKDRVKKEGGKLYAAEIEFYTREVVYNQDLSPRAAIYFQHEDGWMETFEKRISGYRNHVYDLVWPTNILEGNEESNTHYYNDEDYKVFLRVAELKELGGGSTDKGMSMYLVWDKKMDRNSAEYYEEFNKLKDFIRRGYDYGEPTNMYEGSGHFLLDYYKESDPKFYEFVTKF